MAKKRRGKRQKVGWYVEVQDAKGRPKIEVRNGIPDKAMEAFVEALYKVREAFFEKDEDGDYPVRIHVSDRTTHGPNHYEELWHTHKGGPERALDNLRIAASNCEQAGQEMRRVMYDVQDILKEIRKRTEVQDEAQRVRVDGPARPDPAP